MKRQIKQTFVWLKTCEEVFFDIEKGAAFYAFNGI